MLAAAVLCRWAFDDGKSQGRNGALHCGKDARCLSAVGVFMFGLAFIVSTAKCSRHPFYAALWTAGMRDDSAGQ